MEFDWDEDKNEINIRLHGIDFADVPGVFSAPMLTDLDDRIDYGEDRWVSIGMLSSLTVVVVWTERDHDIVRLISARKDNKYERQRYASYLTD